MDGKDSIPVQASRQQTLIKSLRPQLVLDAQCNKIQSHEAVSLARNTDGYNPPDILSVKRGSHSFDKNPRI